VDETLAAVVERLIPGAAAAGVPAFAERRLDLEDEVVADGLARLAAAGFAELEPAEQDARLAELEGGELFEAVWTAAVLGMFSDPRHGGNVNGAGWALLGYPGPRRAWTAEEQQLR
jgi:gluconate 2-dehydrogenase gamma chain